MEDTEYYHEEEYESARRQFKVGNYQRAAEMLKRNLDLRYSRRFRSLNRPLFDRTTCLEQLDREDEIPAMYQEAVDYYLKQMSIASDKLCTAMFVYYRKYGKDLDVDLMKAGYDRDRDRDRMQFAQHFFRIKESPSVVSKESQTIDKRRKFDDRRADPFSPTTGLPTEIIQRILGYANVFHLCRASEVCRNWRDVVVTHSDLYRIPTFGTDIGLSDITKYLRVCRRYGITHIPSIRFSQFEYGQENTIIKTFRDAGLQVDSLDMGWNRLLFYRLNEFDPAAGNSFQKLRTLVLTFQPEDNARLSQLLQLLPALRNVSLTFEGNMDGDEIINPVSFNQLDRLTMVLSVDCTETTPVDFVQLCQFHGCRDLTLDSTALSVPTLQRLFNQTHPDTVCIHNTEVGFGGLKYAMNAAGIRPTTLNVTHLCRDPPDIIVPDNFSESNRTFSRLTTLKLGSMNDLKWEVLGEILDETRENLKVLELDGGDAFEEDSHFTFSEVFQKCPQLEILKLNNNEEMLSDDHCAELGAAMRAAHSRLKKLSLPCGKVTEDGIRSLFDGYSMPGLVLTLSGDSFGDGTIRYLRSNCSKVLYGHNNYYRGLNLKQEI